MKIPMTIGQAPWRPGQWAILAVVSRPLHAFVYAISTGRAELLTYDGHPRGESVSGLLSIDGYREHCDRMADEWTGAQYRAAVEKSLRVPELDPNWPKWLAVASAPLSESWDIHSMPADWERRIAHLLTP